MVELCPICHGKGKVKQEPNVSPDVLVPPTTSLIDLMIVCYGCDGKGWINPDNPRFQPSYPDLFPIFPPYPIYPTYPSYPYYPPNIWCNVSRSI